MVIVVSLLIGEASGDRVSAETILTPSISTAGTYYSNSLFSSAAGGRSEDFGLSVSPQLSVVHSAPLVSAVGQAGVSAMRFINNPNFSFVGINAGASLNLTNLVQRFIPRVSLSVSDYFAYTPQLPGLIGPTLAPLQGPQPASTSPNQPQPLPQQPAGAPFFGAANGIPQGVNFNGNFAGRVNSYTNGASVGTGYAFTQTVGMSASYGYSMAHFGSAFSAPGVGGYFDTTTHSVNVGPNWQVTPKDTVFASGMYTKADYGNIQSTAPGSTVPATTQNYETYGGSVGWSRRISPSLSGSLAANYALVSPIHTSVYGGTASLGWLVIEKTSASLTFSRSVAASYVGFGTAMVSNTVVAGIQRALTPKLSASGSLMGALSESVQNDSTTPGFRYESIIGGLGLSYALSRYFSASAFYSHSWFKSFANGASPSFNLDSVTISISGAFPYKWS